jgi:SAM-dependent methyltransferase
MLYLIRKKEPVLAKTYRAIQQWNHWLQQVQGKRVLHVERKCLFSLLDKRYGKHALLIGSPEQQTLLNANVMSHQMLMGTMIPKQPKLNAIESEFYELPIASGSIDLVLLPHTLEHLDNPRHLLFEACRTVKPDGHIIIFGFNPLSLWGVKKSFSDHKKEPWSANFILASTVKNWLTLAEFQIVQNKNLMYRPPVHSQSIYKKLKWLEWIGNTFRLPVGGIYMVMAQNKSIPLTPIKMRWKQQLSGIRSTIPKPTIRNIP